MEDVFGKRKNGGGGTFFVEKFKNGGRDPIFFMVGTLSQHAWHAKSQSAATFLLRSSAGFCRHFTIIDLVSKFPYCDFFFIV